MFLVFEGMDGCGKTTQMNLVSQYYFNQRRDVFLTREPSNGPYGKKVRKKFLNQKNPMSHGEEMLGLFVKDRDWHMEKVIQPALELGCEVLCDRYYHSNIAYQATQGLDIHKVIDANQRFRSPDLVLLYDLPAKTAIERMGKRGRKTKFEKIEFMENLRKNFLRLPELLDDNINVIDASLDITSVHETTLKELE